MSVVLFHEGGLYHRGGPQGALVVFALGAACATQGVRPEDQLGVVGGFRQALGRCAVTFAGQFLALVLKVF